MQFPYTDLEEVTKIATSGTTYEREKKQSRHSIIRSSAASALPSATFYTSHDGRMEAEKPSKKEKRRKKSSQVSQPTTTSALPPVAATLPRRLTQVDAPSSPARARKLERRDATLERQRRKAIKKRPRTAEVEADHLLTQEPSKPVYSRSLSTQALTGLPPKSPSPKSRRPPSKEKDVPLTSALRQKVDLTNLEFATEGKRERETALV